MHDNAKVERDALEFLLRERRELRLSPDDTFDASRDQECRRYSTRPCVCPACENDACDRYFEFSTRNLAHLE